jgi:hypothetical protein
MEKETIHTSHKLEMLKNVCSTDEELDQVLGKLFDITLNQHRRKLERYDHDLGEFENRYNIDTVTFNIRFEAGELGDAMDFFEWAGIYKLRQDLIDKIHNLESAL